MRKITNILTVTLTSGLLLASASPKALAHGNAHHGSPPRSSAQVAPAEQTAWGIAGHPANV
ncbi:MAG: hypothetical protein ACO3TC_05560, partial [Burkholderiaceae bacterium]